jgi:hypothetical protein
MPMPAEWPRGALVDPGERGIDRSFAGHPGGAVAAIPKERYDLDPPVRWKLGKDEIISAAPIIPDSMTGPLFFLKPSSPWNAV